MKTILTLISCIILTLGKAQASIQLRDIHYNMDGPIITEYISNSSETSNIYVVVDVYKLELNAAGDGYDEVDLPDVRELMVSPKKLVIPPRRTVPIKLIGKQGDELQQYRVRFRAVSVEEASNTFDKKALAGVNTQENKSSATAELLISYGAVAYLNPKNRTYNTVVHSTPKKDLIIENNGNSVIKLTKVKICDQKGSCEHIGDGLLPPNRSFKLDGHKVEVSVVEGKSVKNYAN